MEEIEKKLVRGWRGNAMSEDEKGSEFGWAGKREGIRPLPFASAILQM